MRTPVVVICYNRINTLKDLVESLLNCSHAQEHKYFFFSDAPSYKRVDDENRVAVVRDYLHVLKERKTFENIELIYADRHLGCRDSVVNAVSTVINKYGRVIDLEDDLIVTKDFLDFMDDALDYFESDKSVWSVSGFAEPLNSISLLDSDVYRVRRFRSIGFGIWKDRWNLIEWDGKWYDEFRNNVELYDVIAGVGYDIPEMIVSQNESCLDSWAVICTYFAGVMNMDTVCPKKSRIYHMGHGINAGIHAKTPINQQQIMLDPIYYSFEKCQRYETVDNEMCSLFWSISDYNRWKEEIMNPSKGAKYEKYYLFMNKWMELRENGIEIGRYFKERGVKNIAVYGAGHMAERLEYDLSESTVLIEYYIDKSRKGLFKGKKIYTLDMLLPKVDMIVVMPFTDFYDIKKELCMKCSIPICSIEEII